MGAILSIITSLFSQRSSLEQKLEETHQQLINIKSTWSDKINQLETQVCVLCVNICLYDTHHCCNRRDGVMVKASALQSLDLDSVPMSSYIKECNNNIHSFFVCSLGRRGYVEKKSAYSIDVALVKSLNRIPYVLDWRRE